MLTLNKIACIFITVVVLLLQQSSVVHVTSTNSSLRDWLDSLKSEASIMSIKSIQLEKSVALLMEANSTTIVQARISQLSKMKKALDMLNLEIQVINQTCSTKGGPDCNITCSKGLNGAECIVIPVCDSKCLNCSSSGDCLLCSGNWNGATCSTCKTGWIGINCTVIDSRGDLVTSSILNSTLTTRFVSDIISGVKKNDIKLVFRYSRDGLPCSASGQSSFAPASLVNGKGPTVLIIKATTGAIFGGYTSVSWATSYKYVTDSSAFLFSVQSSTGDLRYTKLSITKPGSEVYLATPAYFSFGVGDDLTCGCVNGGLGGFTYLVTYQNLGQHYLTGSGIAYATTGSSYTALDFELYTL